MLRRSHGTRRAAGTASELITDEAGVAGATPGTEITALNATDLALRITDQKVIPATLVRKASSVPDSIAREIRPILAGQNRRGIPTHLNSDTVMQSSKISRSKVFSLIALLFLVIVAAIIFFFDETEFSLAKISWRHRFERALQDKGEVKLSELVDFKWNKIYLIRSYDFLNIQQEAELFPQENSLDPFWWYHDDRYWTIAYQRPGRPPFLIRIRVNEWYPRNRTNFWTTDPDAKLRRVPTNTIETTYCPSRRDPNRCLALDDARSSAPTVPIH
jgi:hypothetical protein